MYDVAIVGAGINGSALAYTLQKEGLSVALFDTAVAAGGSGAAGAFLSPKFLKSSSVKTFINEALDEAFSFYEEVAGELISRYPLLHIAKDERDAKNIRYMKEHNEIEMLRSSPPFIPQNEYVYTAKSALVDAKKMCLRLADSATFFNEKVESLQKEKDGWRLNGSYRAKNVVLATGAYEALIKEPYLEGVLRGIWGHRIDVKSASYRSDCSIHQYVSISATKDDLLSIGATHDVHFRPDGAQKYDFAKGRAELLQKANTTLSLGDAKVIRDYVGLRSGSIDHLPLVGGVADLQATLQKHSVFELKKKSLQEEAYVFHKGLYMINGSAGYGFVLAPRLARLLSCHIVAGEPIDSLLLPSRFLSRYVRRKL